MFLSELTTSPLALGILCLCAGLVLALAFMLVGQRRRYRILLTSSGTPEPTSIVRVDHAGWHPDRRSDLEAKLADLTDQHTQLQEAHTVLLARHKALIREFQRMHKEAPLHPRPATPRKMGVQA